jgi:hypothetical protein
MPELIDATAHRRYVDSLLWRRDDLQATIGALGEQIALLSKEETELKQQLRALDQLLGAEESRISDQTLLASAPPAGAEQPVEGTSARTNGAAADVALRATGPKSRAIYAAVADALHAAGVPLHYRILAEEVQKKVPLTGADPGATLIAHLHRAQDLFPRLGRGVYGLSGMITSEPLGSGTNASSPPQTTRRRHPKTRRRSR